MNGDRISRAALLSEFAAKCMGECSFCIFRIYDGSDSIRCGLIERAPAVEEYASHERRTNAE